MPRNALTSRRSSSPRWMTSRPSTRYSRRARRTYRRMSSRRIASIRNAAMNVYRAADDTWFVMIVTSDKLAAVAKAIGRPELLTDPRFSDPAKLIANMPQLTAILDEVFGAQPMAHWYEIFSGVHVTFGAVRGPEEVINDPQLRLNDIVVPLEGAGGKLTSTISSPIQVHGVSKCPQSA